MPVRQRQGPHPWNVRYVAVGLAATATMLIAVPVTAAIGQAAPVDWVVVGAALGTAGAAAVVVGVLPWRQIGQRPSGQVVLHVWSLFDLGAVAACIAATGGARSWFWVLFVLTTVFFSAGGYPIVGQLVLVAATAVGYVAAVAAGGGPVLSIALVWRLAILGATFALSSFPSWQLRRETADHATAQREAERLADELEGREAWWRSLIERTSDPIVVFDEGWHVTFASPAFETLLGYPARDIVDLEMDDLVHGDDLPAVARAVAAMDGGARLTALVCRLQRFDGAWCHVEVSATALVDGDGSRRVVANLHDVTDRVAGERRLQHQASHDALTGLANRDVFYQALGICYRTSCRSGMPLAVLVIDLDGFKHVNDTYGHAVGDALLIEAGRRLATSLRAADVLARLGGDEFAVILTTAPDAESVHAVALRVLGALDEPVVVDGWPHLLRASVGVAWWPAHSTSADELVLLADRAMYHAKRTGTAVAFYDEAMEPAAEPSVGPAELRQAVARDELVLHFQPKVTADGRVVGAEALVRWAHPGRGLLGPAAFLSVAEASGLVRAVTSWVVPAALAQAARWRAEGLDLSVAVNVSAQDLADDAFTDRVAAWVRVAEVPADRLIIELTEATAIDDHDRGRGALQRLRALGVRTSLDDFGTGYSSLAYLTELPLDEVKLDRGFLLAALAADEFIVRSMVEIGHHLGLTVMAEGVESEADRDRLLGLGCDEIQGYVHSRPLPADELVAFVAARGAVAGPAVPNAG